MDSPIIARIKQTISDLEADRQLVNQAIKSLRETVEELESRHDQKDNDASALLRDRILSQMNGKMQRPTDLAEALFDGELGHLPEVEAALDDLYNDGLVNKRDRGWWELVEQPDPSEGVEAPA